MAASESPVVWDKYPCCLFLLLMFTPVISLTLRDSTFLFAISDDQSWMHAGAYGDKGTIFRPLTGLRVPWFMPFLSVLHAVRTSIWAPHVGDRAGREPDGNVEGGLSPVFPLAGTGGLSAWCHRKDMGSGQVEGFALRNGRSLPLRSYSSAQTEAILGKSFHERKLARGRKGMSNLDYAANFADFLAERDREKPFFFWYGSTEPHQGYEVGAWKAAGKNLRDALVPGCLPDDPVIRGEFLDYGLEIEHFDQHLARMLEMLRQEGLLDNTLVVVTSDHGNPMPRSKCNLYDSGTRVPLAVRFPGPAGEARTCEDFINLVDLAPTFRLPAE